MFGHIAHVWYSNFHPSKYPGSGSACRSSRQLGQCHSEIPPWHLQQADRQHIFDPIVFAFPDQGTVMC